MPDHGNRYSFALMNVCFTIRDLISPRKEILEEAKIREGDHVLDYGSGTGSYLTNTLRRVGPTGKVYAADVNPLAVAKADSIARKRGMTNITTILTDCSTGLEDGSIDVVLLYDVYHNLADPEAVLRELHRVLKQNGFLSFSDHHLSEEEIRNGLSGSGLFKMVSQGRNTFLFRKIGPDETNL